MPTIRNPETDDELTAFEKQYHEIRAQELDSQGRYIPHQPVYGPSLGGEALRYHSRTYAVMSLLIGYPFSNLLDAACAEGYHVDLMGKYFGVPSVGLDISEGFIKRMKEFYNRDGICGDLAKLPFRDNEFDVVTCLGALEHIPNPQKAADELIRVTNKLLIVVTTVTRSKWLKSRHIRDLTRDAELHCWLDTEIKELFKENTHVIPINSYMFQILNIAFLRTPLGKIQSVGLTKFLIMVDLWVTRKLPFLAQSFLIVKCKDRKYLPRFKHSNDLLDFILVKYYSDNDKLNSKGA